MSEPKPLPKDFQPNFVTVDYAKTWGEEYKEWFTTAELRYAGILEPEVMVLRGSA